MRFLLILTSTFLLVASACKKNSRNNFPNVPFQEYVYLNNPSSYDLTVPGGWIYTNGGYRGLIVIRRHLNNTKDDFAVFDRACPEHFSQDCSVLEVQDDDTFIKCSCSGETYLIFDGSPAKDANYGLYQYPHTLNNGVLYISN